MIFCFLKAEAEGQNQQVAGRKGIEIVIASRHFPKREFGKGARFDFSSGMVQSCSLVRKPGVEGIQRIYTQLAPGIELTI